jgi:uncharacterized protein (TIGR03435 family)
MRYALLALSLIVDVAAQEPIAPAIPTEFEVAVIKRNVSGDASSGGRLSANGQQEMINVSARSLVTQAFPSRGSTTIVGVPSWAETDRYDVTVKADRRRPREESAPMWRALLAERMKLAAHYEPREEPTYDLVFARPDHRLGPQLQPTSCVPFNQAAQASRSDRKPCGFSVGATRISIGPTTIAALARVLQGQAGRLVVDQTSLAGNFDIDLSFSPRQLAGDNPTSAAPSDAPDFFTAVQEQLGLKLVANTSTVDVLVIDRIERPTEN